jgi:hypothetical protein
MIGTVCDVGSPAQGTLQVSYGKQGSVSVTCVPTTLYTLTVTVAGGDGHDSVTSDPAGIDCNPGSATATCSAAFPIGYSVTLTPSGGSSIGDFDTLTSYAGGCSGAVAPFTNPPCTVTMNADTSVTANFAGKLTVTNESNTFFSVSVGSFKSGIPPSGGTVTGPADYGSTVTISTLTTGTYFFTGIACEPSNGATVTANSCTFTLAPGDLISPQSIIITG